MSSKERMKISWLEKGHPPLRRLAIFIATTGGGGNVPIAPGTFGSVAGVLLFLGLGRLEPLLQLGVIAVVLVASLWAAREMESYYKVHDDGRIVIDEVLGVWVALWALPISFPVLGLGFVLFRYFDIFKPFPASWVDRRWPGAVGVIFDDIVAGLYAHFLLRAIGHFLWGWTFL